MSQPVLLCTVGTSWAVVPEAYFFGRRIGQPFGEVHVLTTESSRVSEGITRILEFFDQIPEARVRVCRVAGFSELRDEHDHFLFEEVLYRWVLASSPVPSTRFVCLSGGYKTISAAVQKAAQLFGAREVFHVLCDPRFGPEKNREASTAEEVEVAYRENALRYVCLGEEGGWPQLRTLGADQFPLEVLPTGDPRVVGLRAPDDKLSALVRETLERGARVMRSWDRLGSLPFPELATWSSGELAWLEEPVRFAEDREWVQRLPKVELHTHLGGFATRGSLLRKVRAAAQNPERLPPVKKLRVPSGWPVPARAIALEEYMHLGDNTGSALLKDPGCLREHCRLLYQQLVADNVVYAEIRCSPANYAADGRSPWVVLEEIRNHFQECMDASPEDRRCHVNLIVIATRQDRGDRSRIAKHLALAITAAEHWRHGCRVVGVDLAGFENRETRAALFATDFEPAHRAGLAVTVHAGENDDVEGIWQAVFRLHARRLGHALHLHDGPDLFRVVVERGIGVEMCPFANYQIKGYPLDPDPETQGVYPFRRYLGAGARVTVNTDNIGISSASLSENLLFLSRLCPGVTRLELLQAQANAVDVAFASHQERQRLWQVFSRIPKPSQDGV